MSAPLTNLAPAIQFSDDRKVIASSPFPVTWQQMRGQFAATPCRAALADGFEDWVRAVHTRVEVGFAWIGGSFASDKPEPADVDAVLFYDYRAPLATRDARDAFIHINRDVLSREAARARFGIDAALIPLCAPVPHLIQLSAYWAMVFSNGPDGTRRAFYVIEGATVLAAGLAEARWQRSDA
jgi:hypothetical protein